MNNQNELEFKDSKEIQAIAKLLNIDLNNIDIMIADKNSFYGEAVSVFLTPNETKLVSAENSLNKPSIVINEAIIDNPSYVIISIAHELRHYYQWLIDPNPLVKDYIRGATTTNENYYLQEVEIDAVAFSEIIANMFYNKSLELPTKMRKKVDIRKNEILNELKGT